MLAGGKRKSSKIIYIIIPVVCVSLGLVSVGLCFLCMKVTRKKESESAFSSLLMSENQKHSATSEQTGSGT